MAACQLSTITKRLISSQRSLENAIELLALIELFVGLLPFIRDCVVGL